MNAISVLHVVTELGIVIGAITYTVFAIAYPVWARTVWWRVPVGRALVVSSSASALLLDLTLLFRVVDLTPLAAAIVTAALVVLIAAGGLLKVGALAHEIGNQRRRSKVPPTP